MLQSHKVRLILLFGYSVIISVYTKPACDVCKNIVSQFKEGLEKTRRSGFGGGNTNWEEKSLGKWKTSETRLVEITDHHVCTDSEKQDRKECHLFFEQNEEALEDWYFNMYKDQDNDDNLEEHLCITNAKVCCSPGTFGKTCKECPKYNGEVCGGHGTCKGDGTRSGSGKCSCDEGYEGDSCNECQETFYEQLTGSVRVCIACDSSCEDSCTTEGPKGCDECREGFVYDDDDGCVDIDECKDDETCAHANGQAYCVNKLGSYHCASCDDSCKDTCTGKGAKACTSCKEGFLWDNEDGCLDVNECDDEEIRESCERGTICRNTQGSHKCQPCEAGCASCTGTAIWDCVDCKPGFERFNLKEETSSCRDMDECEMKPYLCSSLEGAQCTNTEGSYECKCVEENHIIKGDKCVDKEEAEAAEAEAKKKLDEEINSKNEAEASKTSDKGNKKSKPTKTAKSKSKKSSQEFDTTSGQPKIDLDEMMRESGKLPPGQKRKYRTLDTMTLISGTGLYLVMVLVIHAEFFKTSIVTIIYSIFLYLYSGSYA